MNAGDAIARLNYHVKWYRRMWWTSLACFAGAGWAFATRGGLLLLVIGVLVFWRAMRHLKQAVQVNPW